MQRLALGLGVLTLLLLGPLPTQALETLFDIQEDFTAAAPPYPGIAHELQFVHRDADGKLQPLGTGRYGMRACGPQQGSLEQIPVKTHLYNSSAGTLAADHFFDIFYDFQPEQTTYPSDSFFDIFVELRDEVGGPGTLLVTDPAAPDGSVDSFFDITFSASSFEIMYRAVTCQPFSWPPDDLCTVGTLGPGVTITNVEVVLASTSPGALAKQADSFFDIYVEISVDDSNTCCDGAAPVLKLSTVGQYEWPPVGISEESWGAVKSLY